MFNKVNVPILGVVENMSYLDLPDGSRSHVFGQGGGRRTAEALETSLLGEVPLLPRIREGGDAGEPAALKDSNEVASQVFLEIASKLLETLEVRDR
jgi:ATP-binding protein involved in chromosome partitioning